MCIDGCIVLPGQKLCPKCRLKVSEPEKEEEEPYKQDELNDESFCFQEEHDLNLSRESLNSTLNELNISPVKLHSVAQHSKPTLGKRKLKQVEGAVPKKLATVLKVDESELEVDGNQKNLEKDIQSKGYNLDFLVECMKEKLKISSRKQKLQILTLIPKSWSVRKASEEFQVSKSTIKKSKNSKS